MVFRLGMEPLDQHLEEEWAWMNYLESGPSVLCIPTRSWGLSALALQMPGAGPLT